MTQYRQDDQEELEQAPTGDAQFSDRELMALESLNPDDPADVAAWKRPAPSLDAALDEAENAVRTEPVSRSTKTPARRVATQSESPAEEEIDYADGGEGSVDPEIDDRSTGRKPKDWIDDDTIDLASGYGLNEDLLRQQFRNREEFERFIPTLDAQAQAYFMQANQQPFYQQGPVYQDPTQQQFVPQFVPQPNQQIPQQQIPSGQQPIQGQATQQTAQAASVVDKPGWKDGAIDVDFLRKQYEEKGFDAETVEALGQQAEFLRATQLETKALKDTMQKQEESISLQRQYLVEKERAREHEDFHNACDSVDPKFFGKSLDKRGRPVLLGKAESDRRLRVGQACKFVESQIIQQQQAYGVQNPVIPPYPVLVRRAMQIAFGREQALRKQSSMRRSVGSAAPRANQRRATTRQADQPITTESQIQELVNNPDLIDAFENPDRF